MKLILGKTERRRKKDMKRIVRNSVYNEDDCVVSLPWLLDGCEYSVMLCFGLIKVSNYLYVTFT